jgi:hypothetical protein
MGNWISISLSFFLFACGAAKSDTEDTGQTPVDTGDTELPEDTGDLLSPLDKALKTGNPVGLADASDLLTELRGEIATILSGKHDLIQGIFQEDAIAYTPGAFSQHLNSARPENVFTLIQGSSAGYSLAAVGHQDTARFAGFGFHLLQSIEDGHHADIQPALERLVAWLLLGDPSAELPSTPKVVVTDMGGYQKATKDWFNGAIEGVQLQVCDSTSALADCYSEADLLVVGAEGASIDSELLGQAVEAALAEGTPVLFLHTRQWNTSTSGERVIKALGMSYGGYGGNYWSDDAANWGSVDDMLAGGGLLGALDTLYAHFQQDDFDFDWSQCTTYVGQTSCGDVPGLRQEFYLGAEGLKGMLRSLDAEGVDLFDQAGRRLSKLALLLADVFRRDIAYPMSKSDADQLGFFEAYYADHVVHYRRAFNPGQADLGSFSDPLDPSTVGVVNVSLAVDVPKDGGSTAAGVYALPGEPFTVRLLDNSGLVVGLYLNTQRTGSTREFDEEKYTRPKFLSSPPMWLTEGQETQFVSPFGGTIQLVVSSSEADQTLHLEIDGVGQHPVLRPDGDPQDFLNALEGSPFPFSEIDTPFVQIHSKTDMMQDAIAAYSGDITLFFQELNQYMVYDTYNLAGFLGEGLGLPQSVQDSCDSLGWDCTDPSAHGRPKVQHINVDYYAHCGGGCSGNPYDQSWTLNPLGWGETHEIGHNLQRGRLMIYSGKSSEVSNQIFPLHKNWSWFQDTGESLSPTRVKNQELFEHFQNAALSSDPFAEAYSAIWENSGYAANNGLRMGLFMQMRYYARSMGQWDNGWDLFTLMYLHERLFSKAVGDSAAWSAQRDGLGFSIYSGAADIDGNDFMLISFSFLSQADQRPFFDLWGVSYSQKAADQVAAYGVPAAPKQMWVTEDGNGDPREEPMPIDGVGVWPF